jgi:hypothetical protein
MDLSRTIASMAVVLGVILAAGYAQGEGTAPADAPKITAQDRLVEREAQRRAAVEEQQKRKDAFERACNRPLKSEMDFDLCRAAYKRLEPAK